MSGKSEKKLRKQLKEFNMQVFTDAVIEISIMPFFTRLGFCLKMAFNSHPLQKKNKDVIKERRKLTPDGKPINNKPKKEKK